MESKLTEQQVLLKLTAMCSRAEHCRKEVMDKMERWGVAEGLQQKVMGYLVAEKYIDEERYCRGFIHDKMEFNRWGKRKIEQALWLKGIPKEVSTPLFAEIDDDRWADILKPLIQAKRRTTKGRDDYEIKQKLMRFAYSRGFLYEQISQCLGDD